MTHTVVSADSRGLCRNFAANIEFKNEQYPHFERNSSNWGKRPMSRLLEFRQDAKWCKALCYPLESKFMIQIEGYLLFSSGGCLWLICL